MYVPVWAPYTYSVHCKAVYTVMALILLEVRKTLSGANVYFVISARLKKSSS